MAECILVGNNGSGGDGGSSDSYFGITAPTSDIGNDGEYYYIRNSGENGHSLEMTGSSGQTRAGWEFYPNEEISIIGFRGKTQYTTTGALLLATTDGTIVAQIDNVQFTANTWVEAYLQQPVTLSVGTNYIVQIVSNSGGVYYSQSLQSSDFSEALTFVRGRYGGTPGTAEGGTAYSSDIIIRTDNVPEKVRIQYYKENGSWVQIA